MDCTRAVIDLPGVVEVEEVVKEADAELAMVGADEEAAVVADAGASAMEADAKTVAVKADAEVAKVEADAEAAVGEATMAEGTGMMVEICGFPPWVVSAIGNNKSQVSSCGSWVSSACVFDSAIFCRRG